MSGNLHRNLTYSIAQGQQANMIILKPKSVKVHQKLVWQAMKLVWQKPKLMGQPPHQLNRKLRPCSVQIEAQFVSVDSVLRSGSALQLEAELVLARMARRSSMIGPARTRLQARYSAQLCSKLGLVSQFEDRLGVRLGAQLGLTRRLSSRL